MTVQQVDQTEIQKDQMSVAQPSGVPPFWRTDEIYISDLFATVWRGKWIVIGVIAATLALTAIWMKVSQPQYTAVMVVGPAPGAGALAGRLSEFSGIAALAGVDLPQNQAVSPFEEFKAIIKSPAVAKRLAKKRGIMPKVFAASWNWDPQTEIWTRKSSLLGTISNGVKSFFGLPPRPMPSAKSLANYLDKRIVVAKLDGSAMERLQFRHPDPVFAGQLLRWLHEEGDNVIREEQAQRTSHQIAYIERKLRTTTAADHRRSLVQLLLDQERQMMMIQVELPYAARVIEPPVVSEEPTSPRPLLYLILAGVAGVILGIVAVFFVEALKQKKRHGPATA